MAPLVAMSDTEPKSQAAHGIEKGAAVWLAGMAAALVGGLQSLSGGWIVMAVGGCGNALTKCTGALV